MTILDHILIVFWVLSWGLIGIIYAHAMGLSLFGLRKWVRMSERIPKNRFAIIIPAHNEETVLGDLLRDLEEQDYPQDLYEVYVVADNCTDLTSEIAKSIPGVRIFHRTGGDGSKGGAIRYALEHLLFSSKSEERPPHDAFVFFDADNRVSRNFLARMNSELCEGHRFIQGHLGTKNPYENWVTRVIFLSYCMTNRLWQLGKRRANLPSQCGGTGFCIDREALEDLGWPMTSVTEDLEMVCLLAQKGIFPIWCHDAVVFDEKPTRLRVALNQRVRWMRGHFTNLFRYFIPLMTAGIARRNPRILDCALYLLYPLCVMTIGIQGILWLLNVTVAPNLLVVRPSFPLLVAIVAMLTYYPAVGIYLETKSRRELAYIPLLLIFNWIWVAACFIAAFTCRDRRWYHTPHRAALDQGIRL